MAVIAQWFIDLSSNRRSEVRFTVGLCCYFVFTTNVTFTVLLRLCKNMYLKTLRFISSNMSISPEVALFIALPLAEFKLSTLHSHCTFHAVFTPIHVSPYTAKSPGCTEYSYAAIRLRRAQASVKICGMDGRRTKVLIMVYCGPI